ncbi:hypothetical protein BDV30DRAFT_249429 [Aspergillus minisclerotigenes]|uniref:Ankyrin repeat-containing domain protein n=1 Tax=Aspergillus minisclerotigenes TaxID=656917 RepID=A0A5N6J178_9EURO|nr:hypothetical protein BDV30DRAFT_249429 [Aspergillus minisclerotigenes]
MIELLLREGADVNAILNEKRLIENLMFYHNTIQACFNIIKIFLSNGANPNSRHYPVEGRPKFWYPLLHLVVRMDDCIGIGPRIDLMRSLQRHGADLNATDYLGWSFLEILYWKNRPFPKNEWYWLLKIGAKITKSMISTKFHMDSTIFAVPRKDQLYDPQYTDEDDESMDSLDFASSMAYHIECRLGHTIFDSDYENSDGSASSLARRKFTKCRYGGLCDRFSCHNAFQVLSELRFRSRKWYTEEAASAAGEMCPGWLCS